MQETSKYQAVFLQTQYSYLHHNVSKNHELVYVFQSLKLITSHTICQQRYVFSWK